MKKIAKLERDLDSNTHSSFHPSEYKPRRSNTISEQVDRPDDADESSIVLQREHSRMPVATPIDGLEDSDLFLPCHYFTYIGGTSTGGWVQMNTLNNLTLTDPSTNSLISIMLSRLRMSVADCITEYKDLGGKVFGHPRPLPNKGIVWHKFSSDKLHAVIEDVVQRNHTKTNQFRHMYPSDKDLCRTWVLSCKWISSADIFTVLLLLIKALKPPPLPSSSAPMKPSITHLSAGTREHPSGTREIPKIWKYPSSAEQQAQRRDTFVRSAYCKMEEELSASKMAGLAATIQVMKFAGTL
jgi:hypothetical protein